MGEFYHFLEKVGPLNILVDEDEYLYMLNLH